MTTCGEEWVGGVESLPNAMENGFEMPRPDSFIWVDVATGAVVGMVDADNLRKPSDKRKAAFASLRESTEEPMFGPPRRPKTIRVKSKQLAASLALSFPDIEVVCGPTPELANIPRAIALALIISGEEEEAKQSYFSPGMTSESLASFFEATAKLYRCKPWNQVPSDGHLIQVSIEALNLSNLVVSVIGQAGENFGFLVFPSLSDYEMFAAYGKAMTRGHLLKMPTFCVLDFEKKSRIPEQLQDEIDSNGWKLAYRTNCPWLIVCEGEVDSRPPTAEEYAMVEALSHAIAAMCSKFKEHKDSWNFDTPRRFSQEISTHAGALTVELQAPIRRNYQPRIETLLSQLAQAAQSRSEELEIQLATKLLDEFADSSFGQALGEDAYDCQILLELASYVSGTSIVGISPASLHDIVFEIIPAKVHMSPSEAGVCIEAARAFYHFLGDRYNLDVAEGCLKVLDDHAPAVLAQALSDQSSFGVAKSMSLVGIEAGFDVTSEEGLQAWMSEMDGQQLMEIILPLSGILEESAFQVTPEAVELPRRPSKKEKWKS